MGIQRFEIPSSPEPTGSDAQIRLEIKNGSGNSVMPILKLKSMPDVPERRVHTARFVGAESVNRNDKGEACNHLVVTVELLDANDSAGKPFRVSKIYNLDGRGVNAFSEDYTSWSGITLTPEQLDKFDTDDLLLFKDADVEIGYRKEGKDLVPVISKFLPFELIPN